eukprot:COSAG01_NODE_56900_length_315_cov_1.662037_1_plen_59_part_01
MSACLLALLVVRAARALGEQVQTICALPALDAACASTRLSRQLKALQALTDDQRKAFNS